MSISKNLDELKLTQILRDYRNGHYTMNEMIEKTNEIGTYCQYCSMYGKSYLKAYINDNLIKAEINE